MSAGKPGRRIEVAYPTGTRTLALPAAVSTLDAAMLAQDIWEEERGQVEVRLMLRGDDGQSSCVCRLPPE